MDGRRLILNDSLTIEGGEAGYSGGSLWLWITGYTMQAAARIFMDPKRTEKIEFQYGEMSDIYRGYTSCVSLKQDVDGLVSVCMVKG